MNKPDPRDLESWFEHPLNHSPNDGPPQYSPEELAEIVGLVRRLGGIPALRAMVTAHETARGSR